MRLVHRNRPNCARRGTATTETVLIIIPLLAVVTLAPFISSMFLDLQLARTEAHRDMFDKTTTMFLMPQALMSNHIDSQLASQFGALTTESRQHIFASFPPSIPGGANDPDGIFDPPGGVAIKMGSLALDLFDDGFPNSPVEGWEYVRRPGLLESSDELHFMTYAATIRSPWTYLGYPMVPTQDLIFEPAQMQDWQGEQEQVDDDLRTQLKLAE